MGLDLRLQHKMTQQLVMTPQLQQAIKLLALSHVELATMMRDEIEQNPVLEPGDSAQDAPHGDAQNDAIDPAPTASALGDAELSYTPDTAMLGAYTARGSGHDSAGQSHDATLAHPTTLIDHVRWQVHMAELSPGDAQIALFLAEEINEDGYLSAGAVAMAAEDFDATDSQVHHVLSIMQQFDPPGVAAKDLRECLLLQAQASPNFDPVAWRIIDTLLPLLERRALPQMARELKVSLTRVQEAVRVITHLEPRPGRAFCVVDTHYITPDIYVYKLGGGQDGYGISLNEEGMPSLRVAAMYSAPQHGQFDGATQTYLQEKLRTASWLIRSIHMRQRTMQRVMQSILGFQRAFFDDGVDHLKPLVLRDVAEDVGMHESTISRVTTNKYVHTPQGIFPFKFFFNSTIQGVSGETLASQSVRSHIQRLVGAEPPHAPLSDQRLVELLREHDIDIARRTVAKYRDMLKIPPSSRRKRVF